MKSGGSLTSERKTAPLTEEEIEELQRLAHEAYMELLCSGLIDDEEEPF